MRYFTIVHYTFARSKEGSMRYTRIDGKIPVWTSYKAAMEWRNEQFKDPWIRHNEYVHELTYNKLRKDHILMEREKNGKSN